MKAIPTQYPGYRRNRIAVMALVVLIAIASTLVVMELPSSTPTSASPTENVDVSTQVEPAPYYPSPPQAYSVNSYGLIIIQGIFVMDPNCFRNWDINCYVTWTVRFTRVVSQHGWVNAAAIFAVPAWTKVLVGLSVSLINSKADSAIHGRDPDGCVQFKYLKIPFMQARSVTHVAQSDKYCII